MHSEFVTRCLISPQSEIINSTPAVRKADAITSAVENTPVNEVKHDDRAAGAPQGQQLAERKGKKFAKTLRLTSDQLVQSYLLVVRSARADNWGRKRSTSSQVPTPLHFPSPQQELSQQPPGYSSGSIQILW